MPDTDEDDICGDIKNDGERCTNPPKYDDGKCGYHTDEKDHFGRPSEIEEYREDILEAARAGMRMEGLARVAGVGLRTLYDYIERDAEFSQELKRARAEAELEYVKRADESGSQFLLERSFRYFKTEKREVDADVTSREAASETEDYEVITEDDGIEAEVGVEVER